MIPTIFPECNCKFRHPTDLEESQCMTVDAFRGQVVGGSIDGCSIVVVAWRPNANELKDLNEGKPVFLSMIGGLAPHIVGTSFQYVTNPS